jgi:3-phenylpropionate/trans-cinnamate dioxygenase ferredoxin reductase subunit
VNIVLIPASPTRKFSANRKPGLFEMPNYKYLIVGGGMTADSAISGIREIDPNGTIGLIGLEPEKPYDRPPLTKGLWKDKPFESIWREGEKKNVQLHLGRKVESIDVPAQKIRDDQQNTYSYEKLFLATGGRPRLLPVAASDQIIYYRTVADYRRLRALSEKDQRFAVIGGGFIGSEIGAALAMNGKQVSLLFPGKGICDRIFPRDLCNFVTDYYRQKGVEVFSGNSVKDVTKRGDDFNIRTDHRELTVSTVIAGIGIEPNVELAKAAGLKVENGIIVNEFLQTTHPNIHSAGDVASFYNPALDKRLRVEHEDNANTMGKTAGRNMAGKPTPYDHLPFFYSDLFDLGYEAVGELDSRLETFADWKTPFREGVIYYFSAGRVRGVLLWNVWNQVDAARKLISEKGPLAAKDLKGRIA